MIRNLALLVIGYSVSHRLFDIAWKGQLSLVYPEPHQYQAALADVSVWTGTATILTLLTGKFVFQVSSIPSPAPVRVVQPVVIAAAHKGQDAQVPLFFATKLLP